VTLGTVGPGDLPVADLADQNVGEHVFRLASHRGAAGRADEFLAVQLMQHRPNLGLAVAAHVCDGASPEHHAHHRGVLQHAFALGGESIQPGSDQPMHPRRQRKLCIRIEAPPGAVPREDVLVLHQPDELLCIQRVATRALQDRLLNLGGQRRSAQQVVGQPGSFRW
jgi:hypothetical protein